MSVEVIAIGGYQEVGKNMTAVRIGEDVIIFDMGIHLDRISMHEDTDIDRMHSLDLIERGVIPDDTLMKDVDGKVKGYLTVSLNGENTYSGNIKFRVLPKALVDESGTIKTRLEATASDPYHVKIDNKRQIKN